MVLNESECFHISAFRSIFESIFCISFDSWLWRKRRPAATGLRLHGARGRGAGAAHRLRAALPEAPREQVEDIEEVEKKGNRDEANNDK